jgi:hypothetical protein
LHKKTAQDERFSRRLVDVYKNNTAGNTAIANTIKTHSARHRFR